MGVLHVHESIVWCTRLVGVCYLLQPLTAVLLCLHQLFHAVSLCLYKQQCVWCEVDDSIIFGASLVVSGCPTSCSLSMYYVYLPVCTCAGACTNNLCWTSNKVHLALCILYIEYYIRSVHRGPLDKVDFVPTLLDPLIAVLMLAIYIII